MNYRIPGQNEPTFMGLSPVQFGYPTPRYIAEKCGFESTMSDCIFVCADHGFSKSRIAYLMVEAMRKRGYGVYRFDCARYEATVAIGQLVRFLRECGIKAQHGELVCVGIDNLVPFDARARRRQWKAITKALDSGCKVCGTILPAGHELVDMVPGAFVVRQTDLLAAGRDDDGRLVALTQRIPKLVEGLIEDRGRATGQTIIPAAYMSELRALVRHAVGDGSCPDTLAVRFAAMLLGRGTMFDLMEVLPDATEPEVRAIQFESPFYGAIDGRHDFSVAGLCYDSVFEDSSALMRECAKALPNVVMNVAEHLMRRDCVARAMVVCGLSSERGDVAELIVTNCTKLVCAGYVERVSNALEVFDSAGYERNAKYVIARLAIAELGDKKTELAKARAAAAGLHEMTMPEALAMRHAELLGAMRDMLRGDRSGREGLFEPGDDRVARELVLCCNALRMILNGEFSCAFDALLESPSRIQPDSLLGALQCMMYHVARSMTGEPEVASEAADRQQAIAIIERSGIKRLNEYSRNIAEAMEVISGREGRFFSAEKAINCADRYGDAALSAAFRVVAAMSDVRSGAIVRAHVRLTEAKRAAGSRYSYLGMVAATVGLAVRALDGNGLTEDDVRRDCGMIADVQRVIVRAASGKEGEALRLEALSRSACNRDVAWLVAFLIRDCHTLSSYVRRVVPPSWIRIIETKWSMCTGKARSLPGATLEGGMGAEAAAERGCTYVSVFGGMRVWVHGRQVEPSEMGRRKGIQLLRALALAKGHVMRRQDLCCALWPDSDYATAVQRLYEATSVVRQALGYRRDRMGTANPLIVDKGQGMVALNMDVVRCDVDEFENEVGQVLKLEGDGTMTSAHALAVERIYGSGFESCSGGFDDSFKAREDALRGQFADAMVAGATSALSESKPMLCVQLAKRALEVDSVREDAMIVLVEALGVLGRPGEIDRVHESYLRAARKSGIGASRAVQEAVNDAKKRPED